MPWREVTSMSERINMCKLAQEGKYNIAELSRDFGVSRKTIYKWLDRYVEGGETALFDRSRRPRRCPEGLDPALTDAILSLNIQYPMWGPRKLHRILTHQLSGEATLSISSVARVLKRHGLSQSRDVTPRQEAVGRFERGEPNDLWQTDFTSPIKLPDGSKLMPAPILDDHSRYCVSLIAAKDCSTASALTGLRIAASRYGLPRQVLSDHGSAFGVSRAQISGFTAYLWALEVDHIQGRYAHPQTQGKLERFNRTLRKECISRHNYTTIEDWNKCFEEYRQIYNEVRPHEALADEVPAVRYKPSERTFAEPDRDYREPGDNLTHRRVDVSGKIWLLQHHVKVGNGLAGWIVAAKHNGNGIWTIQFRDRLICQSQLAKPAAYKPRP